MSPMHDDELPSDARLVSRLVAEQFPEWASLDVAKLASAGTDNVIYRLGADKAVRLPRRPSAVAQIEKEQRWLPVLAPRLPLAVPVPLGRGAPGHAFPWPWSVYSWIEGEAATLERLDDRHAAARELAGFIRALSRIDPREGPRSGPHNSNRGVPLQARAAVVRDALLQQPPEIDRGAARAAWQAALAAPVFQGEPVWLHGDLQSQNLLARSGRLCAVIDFGCLGVGDPACDLMVAWSLLSRSERASFRAVLDPDDATWARGRGWALYFGLVALPYYRETNPTLAGIARHALAQALGDWAD
jgi:aminoglycoside phosphotransferase (APT) family kinase protein